MKVAVVEESDGYVRPLTSNFAREAAGSGSKVWHFATKTVGDLIPSVPKWEWNLSWGKDSCGVKQRRVNDTFTTEDEPPQNRFGEKGCQDIPTS